MSNRILIIGGHGQLGMELSKLLPNAISTGKDELDITDSDAIASFVRKESIDTITLSLWKDTAYRIQRLQFR